VGECKRKKTIIASHQGRGNPTFREIISFILKKRVDFVKGLKIKDYSRTDSYDPG
jgi:hypothetical protein